MDSFYRQGSLNSNMGESMADGRWQSTSFQMSMAQIVGQKKYPQSEPGSKSSFDRFPYYGLS